MPSPTIPRSSSAPFLSSPSSWSSKTRIPPTNRSAYFSTTRTISTKSPYWLAWSNINKLGSLIVHGRKATDSSSDLTEESLEAHNRRQEAAPDAAIIFRTHKNAKCSPYYKGLIDNTLAIKRERDLVLSASSPGRESHATTVVTSSSLSTFVVKMQELSSCFSFSSKSNHNNNINNNPTTQVSLKGNLPPSTEMKVEIMEKPLREIEPVVEAITPPAPAPAATEDEIVVGNDEKPLRERVSKSAQPAPPQQPPIERGSIGNNGDEKEKETTVEVVARREFMWADKYRPKALKDFLCNRDTAIQLQTQTRDIDCNHFILEGPPGVGKKTMLKAMLREAFGEERVLTFEECKTFHLMGESVRSIQVRMQRSSQHVEVNLSDLKGYEKDVIMELIKEAQNNKPNTTTLPLKPDASRAIVLYDADKLSTDAVLYIKWLLERYKDVCKFFFCCCDVSKLQPIMTLCTVVHLFPPSNKEVVEVLEYIAKEEGIELPHLLAQKIAVKSKNNLRQAIRSFEATWLRSDPLDDGQDILTGWEDDIANIAKKMIEEQSSKQLYIIRGKLQNLIEHDVSPEYIFETLVGELKRQVDEPFQPQINSLYKDYNENDGKRLEYEDQLFFPRSRHEEAGKRLNDPVRKRIHQFLKIEEFIAKFMSFYKLSIVNKKSM